MTAPDYGRVKQLVEQALGREGEERRAFVAEACGDDDALRAEVEAALAFGEQDDCVIDAPPSVVADAGLGAAAAAVVRESDPALELPPPETIGPFRIVRRLATGGMGTVYEATQEHPHRRVALKTLRRELISPGLLKRFEREAEILGRLQHPGIAQVHEAGTADGPEGALPYFAMEFVDGRPLATFADEEGLDESARLKLFALVCDAVQHAHEQGVVHRDLKPDNLLVTDDGRPKVLDFGVARATDADIQAATLVTEVGQIMGTLPYMSPEQVGGDPEAIDARSDVYSLGVVLFELLVGRRPHDLAQRSMPEAARVIREEDATRLGSVATRFRGDIETIVGKALEKEPARRYASAAELATDVRRHLADQPIVAHAPTRLYRLRKFVRRHKGLVAGMTLAIVSLSVGLAFALRFGLAEATQRQAAERSAYRSTLASAAAAANSGDMVAARRQLDEVPTDRRGWEWEHLFARTEPFLWELPAPTDDQRGVAFSLDGASVAFNMARDVLMVCDARSGAPRLTIELEAPLAGRCIEAVPGGFLTATEDGRLTHWDGITGALVQQTDVPGEPNDLAWDAVGERLAVATRIGDESSILVGALDDVRPLIEVDDHRPVQLAWSTGGELFHTQDITLWRGSVRGDRRTGWTWNEGQVFQDQYFVWGALDCFGGRVAASVGVGDVRVQRVADEQPGEARVLPHIQPGKLSIAFLASGDLLATTSEGDVGLAHLWDVRTGRELERHTIGRSPWVRASPAVDLLAIATEDRVLVWSPAAGGSRVLTALKEKRDYLYQVAWTPDGSALVARSFAMNWVVHDALDGRVLASVARPAEQSFQGTSDAAVRLPWLLSAEGRRIVATRDTGPRGSTVQGTEFDLAADRGFSDLPGLSWEPLARLPPPDDETERLHQKRTRTAMLSEAGGLSNDAVDARTLATVRRAGSHPRDGSDGAGRFSVSTWVEWLQSLDGDREIALEIADLDDTRSSSARKYADASFSPDGRWLAAARPHLQSGVRIHDTTTGRTVVDLGTDHAGRVYAVAFSPDGERLATAGTDRLVRLWDTATWDMLIELPGHTDYVKDLAWSPDGATLASASGDKTIRLWTTRKVAERTERTREAAARREQQRPFVTALFEQLDDPRAVADAVDAAGELDAAQRHAALRVVRELANAWWDAHEAATDTGR